MTSEITVLAWGCVLLIANIMLAVMLKTRQYGTDWNLSPRDHDDNLPPLKPVAARAARAQANLLETFPIAVAVLVSVVLAGKSDHWTEIGAWTWLGARVIYLPVYCAGIKGLRTGLYLISLIGLGMVLWPLLWG